MNSLEPLSLENIAQGKANKLFEQELQNVLGNINDDEMVTLEKRKITMEFEFKPNAERDMVEITVSAKSKLAGSKPVVGTGYVGINTFSARDPNQTEFKMDNVSSLEK